MSKILDKMFFCGFLTAFITIPFVYIITINNNIGKIMEFDSLSVIIAITLFVLGMTGVSLIFWYKFDSVREDMENIGYRVAELEDDKLLFQDGLLERLQNNESYTTELERKIVALRTSIELVKKEEETQVITDKTEDSPSKK